MKKITILYPTKSLILLYSYSISTIGTGALALTNTLTSFSHSTTTSGARNHYTRRNHSLSVTSFNTDNNDATTINPQNTSSSSSSPYTLFHQSRSNCWRPTISDVERISWGKPAKQKGTGSRGVPHRLNHDQERYLFDQARKKGFLEIVGSGWRSTRREAPLLNTYRSLCDARGQACIVLHKCTGISGGSMEDELCVDLSPMRLPDQFDTVRELLVKYLDGLEPLTVEDIVSSLYETDDDDNDENKVESDQENIWDTRPIYQLPPYYVSWLLPRQEAKEVGKKLALAFRTIESSVVPSKKPVHVKPGKNRRSGGYGIG